MNKKTKRRLAAFQAAQRRSARYHVSQKALRRGALKQLQAYDEELRLVGLGLLDARNKI